MSFTELQRKNKEKYGENGWMLKLKFLITEILEEESGDFGFIIEKLCEEKEIVYSDALRARVLTVLKNWKGLKKEKREFSNGIERYSLE